MIMSSRLWPQFSPNLTQPMPTMATLSLMLHGHTSLPAWHLTGRHFHQ